MIGHDSIVSGDDVRCQCGHLLIAAELLPPVLEWSSNGSGWVQQRAEAAHALHLAEIADFRLYGMRDDEYLQTDPAVVYERWFDDHLAPPVGQDPLEIIEWSCVDLNTQITSADYILERIAEDIGDECGYGEAGEAASKACKHPDVVAACEAMRAAIAANFVGWRSADRELRTLIVTWDPDGEPLLDGEPMYRKVDA